MRGLLLCVGLVLVGVVVGIMHDPFPTPIVLNESNAEVGVMGPIKGVGVYDFSVRVYHLVTSFNFGLQFPVLVHRQGGYGGWINHFGEKCVVAAKVLVLLRVCRKGPCLIGSNKLFVFLHTTYTGIAFNVKRWRSAEVLPDQTRLEWNPRLQLAARDDLFDSHPRALLEFKYPSLAIRDVGLFGANAPLSKRKPGNRDCANSHSDLRPPITVRTQVVYKRTQRFRTFAEWRHYTLRHSVSPWIKLALVVLAYLSLVLGLCLLERAPRCGLPLCLLGVLLTLAAFHWQCCAFAAEPTRMPRERFCDMMGALCTSSLTRQSVRCLSGFLSLEGEL
jgi:hypothetical protein